MLFLKSKQLIFLITIITMIGVFFSCKKDTIISIGAITGHSTVCYGEQSVVYSIDLNPQADYVLWTVPEQAQIFSGQGTNKVIINFGRKTGSICAKFYSKGKEVSPSSCLAVSFDVSNRWCREIDFKGGVRYSGVGFSIGNKGYIGTGGDNSGIAFNDIWEFDPALNSWTQKANFAGLTRGAAVGFSIGNKGYVGTGYNGTVSLKDFWEYDPSLNQWLRKADCGDTLRQYAFGFSIGNKGYIGAGSGGIGSPAHLLNDFYEYDPSTNQWVRKADVALRNGAVGFSIGNKGYHGTGSNGGFAYYKDLWEYDPNDSTDGLDINHHPLGKWSQKANLPGSPRYLATGFSIIGKGYIAMGSDGNNYYKDFYEYDPITNNWTKKPDFVDSARNYAVGFSIANKGYLGTGNAKIGLITKINSDFWVFSQ